MRHALPSLYDARVVTKSDLLRRFLRLIVGTSVEYSAPRMSFELAIKRGSVYPRASREYFLLE